MKKEKIMNRFAILGIVFASIFSLVLVYFPDVFKLKAATVNFSYEDELFDKNTIMTVDIQMDPDDWEDMLNNAISEEYYTCDIVINGETYKNVGIRPKGNTSLSQIVSDDTTDRYSFKVEFDHYVSDQTCYGLDKLALNNIMSDTTYMKEYISYDIMNYLGVPSSLYSYASISVNGETWGLYLALEAVEESFAERNFGSSYGDLYKPEGSLGMGGNRGNGNETQDENQQQTIETDDSEESTNREFNGGFGGFGGGMGNDSNGSSGGADLAYIDDEISSYSTLLESSVFDTNDQDYKRVIEALKNLSNGTELENYIDVEEVLRYFASNVFLINDDSYLGTMLHNYYLYEKDGKLSMVPWDYNLAFGGFQGSNATSLVNRPIDTVVSGTTLDARPMIGKLLEVDAYKDQYHTYLEELISGYFESGLFEETITNLDALISTYVENDPTAFYSYEEYKTGVENLKEFCLLRSESIRGQLDGTIPATEEEQANSQDTLLDASNVNISAMGTQGGGNMKGGQAGQGMPGGNIQGEQTGQGMPSGENMQGGQGMPNGENMQGGPGGQGFGENIQEEIADEENSAGNTEETIESDETSQQNESESKEVNGGQNFNPGNNDGSNDQANNGEGGFQNRGGMPGQGNRPENMQGNFRGFESNNSNTQNIRTVLIITFVSLITMCGAIVFASKYRRRKYYV